MVQKVSSGKVRDIYQVDANHLVLVTTDRVSAFDSVLGITIPSKGVVLNRLSKFWLNFANDIVDTHLVSTDQADMPEEFQGPEFEGRCMLVHKLGMIPVEAVVRGYITGSGWESYQKTGCVCGIKLPEGLQESQKLPEPIFTPTTKEETGHDKPISFEEMCELIGKDLATEVRNISIKLYSRAADYAKYKGIIIADTKFEFGIDDDGHIVLADEVLTPDSSRFWPEADYEVGRPQKSYDKQYLRDWLKSQGWNGTLPAPKVPRKVVLTTALKYVEAYEALTDETL